MANIVAVGIAALDIINTVSSYPQENQEIRAIQQRVCRGGNAANTLVMLSQLGHCCYWAGTWANEPNGQLILDDLKNYHINTQWCCIESQGKVPTSYVTLNQHNGSRTIVHYRDLPEFGFADFQKVDLDHIDWIHFEGRNVADTVKMLQQVTTQYPHLPISLEVEKMRENIEQLYAYPHVLLFSQAIAHAYGYDNAPDFLHLMHQKLPNAQLFCAWGEQGAYAIDSDGQLFHVPAYIPPNVVDTLGAGDTFNAGIIHSLCQNRSIEQSLHTACYLAGIKCGQMGFELSATHISAVQTTKL